MVRSFERAVLLSYGFRPFFLAAGVYAALAMLVWLPLLLGNLSLPSTVTPRDWHIHEMVYGYAAAAIAGFLLTAIPNWTGRAPVRGGLLLVMILAWMAGRLAIATSAVVGEMPAALVDLLFLPLVAAVVGREIVSAGNWRNLKVLGVLGVLIAGNVVFHVEVLTEGMASYGQRIGLAAVVGLIVLIGGRIVPAFTRNALSRRGPGRLPQPFGRFDIAAVAAAALALAAWTITPEASVTGALALLGGVLQAARLLRWAGDRSRGDWLVLVLHLGYGFIPVGFLLLGAADLLSEPGLRMAAIHAWGVGALGIMTLAVMSRATLGHTGRPLAASRGTIVVYLLILTAALARIGAAAFSDFDMALLYVAAIAWIGAFSGFAFLYGPMMLRSSLQAGPPGC